MTNKWVPVILLFVMIAEGLELSAAADKLVGIQVIDQATRRGIPMVELITVDDVVYLTDSAGRVALHEPELAGETVFFRVQSPGYQVAKDGFGIEGVRLQLSPGTQHEIPLKRTMPAERLYRITGRDIYLDSLRLGHSVPIRQPLGAGKVVGQDSVQPALFNGKIYWFWGDTNQLKYPLGLFRTAGAVSELPAQGGLHPHEGIDLTYYTRDDGFARAMVHVANPEGVVWIHGVCVVPDGNAQEHLIAQYSRRRGLAEPLEQGLVEWDRERERFEAVTQIDLRDSWRIVRDHPILQKMDGTDYVACGNPFPVTRVPAHAAAVRDRDAYESWTCRAELADEYPSAEMLRQSRPLRDSEGRLTWAWRKAPPVTQQDEQHWLKDGVISIEEARFLPRDADQKDRVVLMHSGSVQWNAFRRRWVLIAIEQAWSKESPSFLGEVFYSEAETPQGPFVTALKVATHPKQSFYNPCHHPFFDQDGGRLICFEGTYCNSFTSSPATPRYNYNQLMYRLDLAGDRIIEVFGRR